MMTDTSPPWYQRPAMMTLMIIVAVALIGGIIALIVWAVSDSSQDNPDTASPSPSATVQAPSPLPPEKPKLDGVNILLDPGHNGGAGQATYNAQQVPDGRGGYKDCQTTGTSTDTGYPEHRFNWEVASRLATLLEDEGATVALTRPDDAGLGPCVDERGAMTHGRDLVVSIHGNGTPNRAVKGYFAIISSPPVYDAQGQPSEHLAQCINNALHEAGFTPSQSYPDQISRRADIAGLNFSEAPMVMMELGEMRNGDEAAVMSSAEGQQRYADALFAGIVAWVDAQSSADGYNRP